MRKTLYALIAAIAAAGGLLLAVTLSASAATSATATTALHGRDDSGFSGNTWAHDALTRTASVSLSGIAPLTDCSPTATSCYAYTGTVEDTGTFFAITGATSPGAKAVPITGTPSGTVKGGSDITFYASSQSPDASLVPASVNGSLGVSTTDWVEQFFPAGTTFGDGPDLTDWSWSYADTATCEHWTDAFNVSQAASGDITGVSQCPPPPVASRLTAKDICGTYSARHWDISNVAGGRARNFEVFTLLNSGKWFSDGSGTVDAGSSVMFVTHRGGELKLHYGTGTGKQVNALFAAHNAACTA